METALALVIGVFFAVSLYLLLSRTLIRIVLGIAVLGNAFNLLIFTAGRLTREVPPIVPADLSVPEVATSNPLPQALVLTAIVIGFSFFAFLLVLTFRAYQEIGSDDSEQMRVAEPEAEGPPPLGY